jgi:hypothetical protein
MDREFRETNQVRAKVNTVFKMETGATPVLCWPSPLADRGLLYYSV